MFIDSDRGCWADGALGHSHVRSVMAQLLIRLYRHHPRGGDGLYWKSNIEALVSELGSDMSDDASEEDDAIEWLNHECYDDTYFSLCDGDLLLMTDND